MRDKEVDIDQEDDPDGFLGVKLERGANTGFIEMCQDGLIDRLISQWVLDDGAAKVKWNASKANPLFKYEDCLRLIVQLS